MLILLIINLNFLLMPRTKLTARKNIKSPFSEKSGSTAKIYLRKSVGNWMIKKKSSQKTQRFRPRIKALQKIRKFQKKVIL